MALLSQFFKKKEEKKGLVKEWSFSADSVITSAAAVNHDLIVFGTKNGKIYALDHDGKEKWVYETAKSVSKEKEFFSDSSKFRQISSNPIIKDIDDDGYEEIILSTEAGKLIVLKPNGKVLWNFSAQDAIKASPLIADINKDKKLEIIFGSDDNYIYNLNDRGKLIWKYKMKSGIQSTPELGPKRNQIVFGTNDGMIYSLNKEGKILWDFKTEDKVTAQPVITSINNDIAIIIGSQDKNLYALDSRGSLLWKYPTGGKIFSKSSIFDLNHDKNPEMLVGSCDDKLHVISHRGIKMWDYETNFWVVSSPLVFDINKDNKIEIVMGSYDGMVYVLDGEADFALDYVPGISSITQQSGHYFDVITKEPGDFYGNLLCKYNMGSIIIGITPIEGERSGILITTNTKKLDKLIYS